MANGSSIRTGGTLPVCLDRTVSGEVERDRQTSPNPPISLVGRNDPGSTGCKSQNSTGNFCTIQRDIAYTWRDEIDALPLGRTPDMAKALVPLTSLSEEQRAEAYARFEMLRPVLEEGVSQAQIVRTHQLSKSAVQRWVKRYREQGLAGLVTAVRSDKGKSRRLPDPGYHSCGRARLTNATPFSCGDSSPSR